MKFSELVRLLEKNGFKIIKEKGSIRYYGKPGWDKLIRVDYHGSKEVPVEDCLFKARWGMKEHVELLKEKNLTVPERNTDPKIVIQNERKLAAA